MKFQVFKIGAERWRFTNFEGIAGDCDSWREAMNEAQAVEDHLAGRRPKRLDLPSWLDAERARARRG